MEDLKKLSQQVLAGIRGGDTNAGTGNAIVDNFARSAFVDVLNKGAGSSNGIGNMASIVDQQQKEAAEAARKAQMQKIQDQLDPSKYQRVRSKDGGFDFFDPEGKPIDIKRYAQVTGMNPSKILADSDNPFDRQYVNDYQNTRDLITAVQNGDTDTISTFKAENQDLGSMKPEDIMRELIRKYPHIYGGGNYNDSYKNNNSPLLRYNLGMGGSSGSNYGFDL